MRQTMSDKIPCTIQKARIEQFLYTFHIYVIRIPLAKLYTYIHIYIYIIYIVILLNLGIGIG